VTLSVDNVRMLARVAGMNLRDEDVAPIAQRLNAILLELAAVSDAVLAGVEPEFLHLVSPLDT
jgi:hypothetical protein